MMYTLDLLGHDAHGHAAINRFGMLFMSVDDAVALGRSRMAAHRLAFHPEILSVRDQEGQVATEIRLDAGGSAQYSVSIASASGDVSTHSCAGSNDQSALIYAGKVVEAHADRSDHDAVVTVSRGAERIGPTSTVGEMIRPST